MKYESVNICTNEPARSFCPQKSIYIIFARAVLKGKNKTSAGFRFISKRQYSAHCLSAFNALNSLSQQLFH